MGKLWDWIINQKVQATVAFFAGLATLVGTALAIYVYYKPPPAEPLSPSAHPTLNMASPASSTASSGVAADTQDLNGAWVGRAGLCHLISAKGSVLSITTYSDEGQLLGSGWGTFRDGTVDLRYKLSGQKQHAVLTLSKNGKTLAGRTDTPNKEIASEWRHVGPDCPQAHDKSGLTPAPGATGR